MMVQGWSWGRKLGFSLWFCVFPSMHQPWAFTSQPEGIRLGHLMTLCYR